MPLHQTWREHMKRYLFLLLLCTRVYGADTPSHFIHGGLLCGTMAKLAGASKTVTWISFGVGGLIGALPDIAGATGYHATMDWPNYTLAHRFGTTSSFLPPITLHLAVDGLFHGRPGENWWPSKAPQAIAIWIIQVALLYFFTDWVNS